MLSTLGVRECSKERRGQDTLTTSGPRPENVQAKAAGVEATAAPRFQPSASFRDSPSQAKIRKGSCDLI